jgi:hypothetical protein
MGRQNWRGAGRPAKPTQLHWMILAAMNPDDFQDRYWRDKWVEAQNGSIATRASFYITFVIQ